MTAPTPGVHIGVPLFAKYADLEAALNAALKGDVYTYGKKKFKIKEVHVYDGGAGMTVRVDVGGAMRGRLFLQGTPAFDPVTRALSVPDLDYSVETGNALVRVVDWFMHDKWRDGLESRSDIIRLPTGEVRQQHLVACGLSELPALGPACFHGLEWSRVPLR